MCLWVLSRAAVDRCPYPFMWTCEIPTLSYTWSLKKEPFRTEPPRKGHYSTHRGHEDTYFFAIFCWRPVYFCKVWRLAVIESRRLRMEWRIDLNHDTRHLCTGKQKIKLANARNRDRLCFFRTKRRFNSHAKCTDWVSTELTSLLLAVRTSTVVTALKK